MRVHPPLYIACDPLMSVSGDNVVDLVYNGSITGGS